MIANVNELTRSLLGKATTDECDVEELQHLVNQYPWFAAGQLLLTKKLKNQHAPDYAKQLQKATLYFPDPLWLDHLLDDSSAKPIFESAPIAVAIPERTEMEAPATFEEVVVQQPLVVHEQVVKQHEEEQLVLVDEPGRENGHSTREKEPALKIPQFKIEPINAANQQLTFEPYHTVDYFAALGIKLKEDDKPKDKFTQQLKSFTEWLKVMRKVPAAELSSMTGNTTEEKKVEQMAEHSIADREVVTEAMAEVWEKQGDHQKASEIYQKLSLLDPPKSSYFAAEIDQLKQL